MGSENNPPHAIIFPFMAQGHTFPLLDFAKVLSQKGLKVTIITTPSNAKQIISIINPIKFPNISTHVIPFPIQDDLPQGCENTKDLTSLNQLLYFLRATLKFKEPFEFFLREVQEKTCHSNIFVVCDFFLGWVMPICSSLNIPSILFYGMGVLSSVLWQLILRSEEHIKRLANGEEFQDLPRGFRSPFPLTRVDFSELFANHPTFQFFFENSDHGSTCWGVLCNSFEELEGEYVDAFESSYKEGVKVWCVGPLFLYDQTQDPRQATTQYNLTSTDSDKAKGPYSLYSKWLDEQLDSEEGVIYVSFGSQSHMLNTQMDEIALGLEMAGHRFVWAVRSKEWDPPQGWEARVKGLVIREWVDQRSILAHPSIKGFLSHCGWNSVLESLSMGVPILCWPLGAEQPQNAKFVTKVLKVGLEIINTNNQGIIIEANEISSKVKELMGGERGRLAREMAKEIGKMARKAVSKDGSSSKKLDQLIESLITCKNM